MPRSADIILRLAGRLPISPDEMIRFTAGLEVLVEETLQRGEAVELLTFGTLTSDGGERGFIPHSSLLPGATEDGNES
jgi:hypothetical protein